ncbi:MAG: hypothetical protein RR734_02205 [Bacilli bacterium]|uniref:hypothetical protein n=1 Tax=Anaerorhabdus sp. TaxID=1872524 RepID=UPI002FCC3DD0
MAFYFSNKLSVEIEDKQYTIDLSTNNVIEAIKEIKDKSVLMAKIESPSNENITEYFEALKIFVSKILGEQECEELLNNGTRNFEDFAALVQYLLIEIDQFKRTKLNQYSTKTPKQLN